jgi:hypothetical protein
MRYGGTVGSTSATDAIHAYACRRPGYQAADEIAAETFLCDSPLYNSDVHVSELRATLHYVRSGL